MSSPNIRQKSPVPRASPSAGVQLARQSLLTSVSSAGPLAACLVDGTPTASFRRFNCTVFGVLGIIFFIYFTVVLCVVSNVSSDMHLAALQLILDMHLTFPTWYIMKC